MPCQLCKGQLRPVCCSRWAIWQVSTAHAHLRFLVQGAPGTQPLRAARSSNLSHANLSSMWLVLGITSDWNIKLLEGSVKVNDFPDLDFFGSFERHTSLSEFRGKLITSHRCALVQQIFLQMLLCAGKDPRGGEWGHKQTDEVVILTEYRRHKSLCNELFSYAHDWEIKDIEIL